MSGEDNEQRIENRRKNQTEAGPARKHALKSEAWRDRLSDAKTAQISVNMIFVKSKEIQVAIFSESRAEGLLFHLSINFIDRFCRYLLN